MASVWLEKKTGWVVGKVRDNYLGVQNQKFSLISIVITRKLFFVFVMIEYDGPSVVYSIRLR